MPNFVNFNKSDEHCRICPACRRIRDELAPYKQMFEVTGQFTRKKSKKKIQNKYRNKEDASGYLNAINKQPKQRKNWGAASKIDEEDFTEDQDQADDSNQGERNKPNQRDLKQPNKRGEKHSNEGEGNHSNHQEGKYYDKEDINSSNQRDGESQKGGKHSNHHGEIHSNQHTTNSDVENTEELLDENQPHLQQMDKNDEDLDDLDKNMLDYQDDKFEDNSVLDNSKNLNNKMLSSIAGKGEGESSDSCKDRFSHQNKSAFGIPLRGSKFNPMNPMKTHYTSKYSNNQNNLDGQSHPDHYEVPNKYEVYNEDLNGLMKRYDSDEEGLESENQDEFNGDINNILPRSKYNNNSTHHDYSEMDFSGDEVFELPSNSESFPAGTLFRAGKSCYHEKVKEAELGRIIFRARLMIKQRELTIKNKSANPKNIDKKLTKDEDYYPLYPEHSRRKFQKIAKQVCKKRVDAIKEINNGLDEL